MILIRVHTSAKAHHPFIIPWENDGNNVKENFKISWLHPFVQICEWVIFCKISHPSTKFQDNSFADIG